MDEDLSLVIHAFEEVDIPVAISNTLNFEGDLVLDPDGMHLPIELKRWSLVTEETVSRLRETRSDAGLTPRRLDEPVLLLVGDRITKSAKQAIRMSGWGYVDLRGEISLRSDRLILQATFEPLWSRPGRAQPLGGKVGLEVATHILLHSDREHAVRELARELGRSASTVSEVIAALRGDGYLSAKNELRDSRLFWAVADSWPTDRIHLHEQPIPGPQTRSLGLELTDPAVPGWALTDTAAAAAYGAPIAVRSGQTLDFFVPTTAIKRRAQNLLHATGSQADVGCTVRVAPVPAVCRERIDLQSSLFGEWPAAHPVFVALDLAQDQGRGREILDDWTPDGRWTRVW